MAHQPSEDQKDITQIQPPSDSKDNAAPKDHISKLILNNAKTKPVTEEKDNIVPNEDEILSPKTNVVPTEMSDLPTNPEELYKYAKENMEKDKDKKVCKIGLIYF